MLKKILNSLLFCALIAKQILILKASECALNTECTKLSDCNRILQNLNLIKNIPYCNLSEKSTFVCCPKSAQKYVQAKDEDSRAVKECKSYQSYRPTCTKELVDGGNKAEPKEFPFMALLIFKVGDKLKPLCSGTLISNKFVLTVAHCFYTANSPNMVRLGEINWSNTQDNAIPVDFEIQSTFIHPEYFTRDIQDIYNDIALVELAKEVVFNEYILPACLPLVDGRDFEEYMTAGWGYPNDTHPQTSEYMLKTKLDYFDIDTCNKNIEPAENLQYGVNRSTQMCAGSNKNKYVTCWTNSGSPLFVDHPDYKCMFLVSGIDSFSQYECGNVGQPNIYTRIQAFLNWIEQTVWKKAE